VRLSQIVANLLLNAAKFTSPGGRIAIAAARDGDNVRIRLSDNGIGIAAASIDSIFGLFAQSGHSPDRVQDGLGIVFDDWDERLGVRLDRELICEMIIRYVLSEILVPEAAGRRLFPVRVKKLLGALIMGSTSRTRR